MHLRGRTPSACFALHPKPNRDLSPVYGHPLAVDSEVVTVMT
jgi:hypothetical protein